MLEKSTLQDDRPDTWQGKPARLLVIRLDLRLDEEGRKAMKSGDAQLKVWLDSEGVPLAMERDVQVRFSKFFVSFRVHEHEAREYLRAGGRLVVKSASRDTSGAGLGHSDESHTQTTVTLLP
jgi:hypothetical protein